VKEINYSLPNCKVEVVLKVVTAGFGSHRYCMLLNDGNSSVRVWAHGLKELDDLAWNIGTQIKAQRDCEEEKCQRQDDHQQTRKG